MKTLMSLVVVSGLMVSGLAQAQDQGRRDLGVGAMVGEPTGLSVKKWLGNDRAIDAGVAWSFSENESLHVHADYLFHRYDVFQGAEVNGELPLYFGVGGRVKLEDNDGRGRNDDDDLLGVRAPVGIAYMPNSAPVDVFAEIAPIMDIAPDTDLDLNAAIGARYYF